LHGPVETLDLEDLLFITKRLGWVASVVFLELNGLPAAAVSNDTVHDLIIAIAAGQIETENMAALLSTAISHHPCTAE